MELEGFITGLGLGCMVGFAGLIIEVVQLRRRVDALERYQRWLVSMSQSQQKNYTSLATSVYDLLAMRKAWLGLVK